MSIHDCIRVPKELFKKNVHPYYCCASYGPNHPYYQEDRVGAAWERQVCAEARHEVLETEKNGLIMDPCHPCQGMYSGWDNGR